MPTAIVTMPTTAKRGEVIAIRALVAHPMETGYRPGDAGGVLPRDLIRRFSCHYNGALVFSAELFPAIAANPLIAFCTVATETGQLRFTWEGDNGFVHTESASISVT